MLVGQSLGNFAGLERKLLGGADEQPTGAPEGNAHKSNRRQPQNKIGQTSESAPPNQDDAVLVERSNAIADGFLF